MPYLKSISETGVLLDAFKAYPDTAKPLLEFHEVLLRGPSPFTVAERELIAAYVSGLNACAYCHGVHRMTAERFGVPEGLIAALLEDLDAAPIDRRMKPVLRYVGKLTRTPSRMTEADAEEIYRAGWNETALHDAVATCALFNMMNRLVEGWGVKAGEDYFKLSSERLAKGGYGGLAGKLDAPD